MKERNLTLKVDQAAREYLAEEGYDPDFGARPLKRTIQREVQDPLALKVVSGEVKEGDTIEVTRVLEGLQFEVISPIEEAEKQLA
jgi:ATP-dependent Clp protease ATP-binding subunit ClpB